MPRFKKKPIEIEAVQLTWQTWNEVCEFADVGKLEDGKPQGCYIDPETGMDGSEGCSEEIGLSIPTLEGVMLARENDWIIRGVQGELYPCKPDIFEASYDPVEE